MTHKARRTTSEVATLGFLLTFAAIRGITYSIHVGIGPLHNVSAGGTHIHHMVWGIVLLLAAGYFRLIHDGHGARKSSGWSGWLTAAAYGAGAALTLDEFALWLNMRDVYWQLQGWQSVVAVLAFAVILLAAVWGRGLVRSARRVAQLSRASWGRRARVAAAGE